MNLNLDQQIIDALDELARRERRSRSMMANLLLEQALASASAWVLSSVHADMDPPRTES